MSLLPRWKAGKLGLATGRLRAKADSFTYSRICPLSNLKFPLLFALYKAAGQVSNLPSDQCSHGLQLDKTKSFFK